MVLGARPYLPLCPLDNDVHLGHSARVPDEVRTLDLGFVPNAGDPSPELHCDEHSARLTFYGQRTTHPGERQSVVIYATACMIATFGYPNDEALPGHPLYAAGLGHYGIFEVGDSSWKRHVIKQNRRCFPRTPPHYESLRHFVVTFQDSTFECLAQELTARSLEANTDPTR